MEALLYTRVSREEQVKFGLSLGAQLEALKSYCAENNLKIRNIYSDEGISGGSIKKRKAFQKMIKEAEPGDIILFTKLDRFSRNLIDANLVVQDLEERNISIKAINEDDIDTSTADGKFIFNLKLSLAQREREKVSERIKDVNIYKIKKGEAISGTVPYGYKIENKKYVIVESEAQEIRDLFDMFIKTQNLTNTTNWWNENHPNDLRSSGSLRYSKLKNKIYLGIHPSGLNNEFCEPIITKEQFDETQRIFEGNRNIRGSKTKTKNVYLFSKLIRCPKCGCTMAGIYGSTRNGKYRGRFKYYRCNALYRSKDHLRCDFKHYLYEKRVERVALDGLIAKANETVDVKLEPEKSNIVELEKKLEQTKNKIKRLKDIYVDGLLTREEFDEKYKDLQNLVNEIQTSLDKEDENKPTNLAIELKGLDIESLYNKLTPENKQIFWRKYINRIEVDEDTLEITVVYQ